MHSSIWASALCLLGSVMSGVAAAKQHVVPKPPGVNVVENVYSREYANATFEQPIDHNDPSKGTFLNRFWFNSEYWKGPGSPVFLFMVGEEAADNYLGYLDNTTIPGHYAEKFGGLTIVIEHRYFGKSLPFDTLTAETLQYLDLPQSMMDIVYFAQNVSFSLGKGLPMNDNAADAPWVLIGGSYPGALAAWISQIFPGVFHAYHASSAVVQTISDFYEYFKPVLKGLPSNCSADVRSVVQYVDHVLGHGSDADIKTLKNGFGLGYLDHHDDFATQVSLPLRQWQGDEYDVFEFCDFLETSNSSSHIVSSNPNGVGLATALPLYQAFIKTYVAPSCAADQSTACNSYVHLDKFNTPDDFANNRQWEWLLCHNPFGWWQVGPNVTDGNNIVSQYVTLESSTRTCALRFPTTNGFSSGWDDGFTPEHLDLYTGGWDADFKRVLFVNGEVDPWREATVSADSRPNGRRSSTEDMPIIVIPNGNHCPELTFEKYEGAPDLYKDMVAIMERWLNEWEKK
ncbi:serine-type peptidase [Ophiostoma piceae UAMH 11346]|uniref:Serine-type peptidase n=1 Tax=Ophiostoma piceae (strain UAMH 11346) TaxID=1262450 RepID=S3BPK7_OPHP1|nr:serine-type peptidase [Ophiostoma piceae UAMH 11346]